MKSAIVLATALLLATSQDSVAQESSPAAESAKESSSNNWYYGPTGTEPETKPLGRLRAEARARQRTTRLESMRWYGFSASRPTASGIPFTTKYSPSWTRPGGRPFAWYTSQRPVVNVTPYYSGFFR